MRWVWGDRPVEGLTITLSRGESFVLQGDALWRREQVSHFNTMNNMSPMGPGGERNGLLSDHFARQTDAGPGDSL